MASGNREAAAAGTGSGGPSWAAWRRSRPFWGGLLLMLGGVELLFIPLEDVFMRGAVGVVLQMGIGGVSGVLIGAVLTACGLLLWFDPGHRMFYGVVGVLGGVVSLPATNFGGFFIGLLLGVIGGSMAFGWTDVPPAPKGGTSGGSPRPSPPDEGMGLILGAPPAADGMPAGEISPAGRRHSRESGSGASHAGRTRRAPRAIWRDRGRAGPGNGSTLVAIAVTAAIVAGPLLVTGRAEASQTSAAGTGGGCFLIIFCSPSPGPSPASPGSPSVSPSSPPSGGLLSPGVLIPPVSSLPGFISGLVKGAGAKNAKNRKSPHAVGTPGVEAYTAPVALTAGAVRVTGFAYQGVADLPVADGGTVPMMKFTATSFRAFNDVKGAIGQGGDTTTLTSPSLMFSGGIVLYAKTFSGNLLGVPLTLTPSNAESLLLQLLNSVTPVVPLTLTNVAANQPIIIAKSLQGQLTMSTAG